MPRTGRPPLPEGQRVTKAESEKRYIAQLRQKPEQYAAYLARRREARALRMLDDTKRLRRNVQSLPSNSKAQYEAMRDPARWPARMLVKIRCRCKKHGIPFSITVEDLQVPDVCPVLGTPFVFGSGEKYRGDANPSVDRLRPELGYVKGNVKVISWRANHLKNNCTQARQLRLIADYMVKHLGE